ncbi:MAG: hypothetical protein AAFX99_23075, partial [Myxococcota bacterium]
GPRQWSKGSGQPGRPSQPGTNSGAMPGTNHSDEETPGKASGNTHFDTDRTTDAIPEEQMAEYKELYEELLMDDPNRILTAVKGQRGEDVGQDQVDVLRGGQQSPRNEQAQGVIKRLPVSYAEDARESINSEQVPPGYRDAVRGYFDQGR